MRSQRPSSFSVRCRLEVSHGRCAGSTPDSTTCSTQCIPVCRKQIQREIDATDRRIDQLVYELYGLTDDEIPIVEDATR